MYRLSTSTWCTVYNMYKVFTCTQLLILLFSLFSDIGVFSDLIRELASNLPTCQNMFPPGGSVFDYYLDLKTYCFTPWNQKKQERKNTITDKQYITVPEVWFVKQYIIIYVYIVQCTHYSMYALQYDMYALQYDNHIYI